MKDFLTLIDSMNWGIVVILCLTLGLASVFTAAHC